MGHNLSLRTRRLLARGISPYRNGRKWAGAQFVSPNIGNRAKLATGTANSGVTIYSKVPGTSGNTTTFRIVVAGANTAESVTSTGVNGTNLAITYNAATNGSSASISTASMMTRALNFSATVGPYIKAQHSAGSDATGTVSALGATSLTGAV